MGSEILIVTPHSEFGDELRDMLSAEQFELHITSDFSEAIRLVRQTGCPLAILDADMEQVDISVQDIGYALVQLNGDIELVILTNRDYLPELSGLNPKALLPKPLDEHALKTLLAQVFPPEIVTPSVEISQPLLSLEQDMPWLNDVRRAAQHLTRLTLESSAQAALIARESELWAYAGQLSQAAAHELTQMVQRYWDWRSNSDLLRFVRLAATEQAHMLYATRLSSNMILALVFDGETPFSTIRSQAGKLATSLSSLPTPIDEKVEEEIENDDAFDDPRSYPHISTLLTDVPPPIPADHIPESMPAEPGKQNGVPAFEPTPVQIPARPVRHSIESSPARLLNGKHVHDNSVLVDETVPPPVDPQSLVETRPMPLPDDLAVTRKQVVVPDPDPQSLAETRPQLHESDESVQRLVLEPVSAALYNLNFACLLIPRFETHHLVGDLADRIGEWIPQLCIAFGWRLEYLSVRPQYLQWVVNVPPASSPSSIMKQVRQHSSDRIFKEFPRLKNDNPSGDFWAPGYLIMGGQQPHPPKFVQDFIKQTRQRQGINGNT